MIVIKISQNIKIQKTSIHFQDYQAFTVDLSQTLQKSKHLRSLLQKNNHFIFNFNGKNYLVKLKKACGKSDGSEAFNGIFDAEE